MTLVFFYTLEGSTALCCAMSQHMELSPSQTGMLRAVLVGMLLDGASSLMAL